LTRPDVKRLLTQIMSDGTKINKRLAFLEKVTAEGTDDPLAWYGLAMEYRKLERWDEALQTFTTLRTRKPDYLAMYLMCGQMLSEATRKDEAREWLETGLAQARAKGDSHAASEIEAALSTLD
jgi:predicted Zn-dependent protease